MPFVPLIVNILLYFAGYTPLERHQLFGSLPEDIQSKLTDNDVALSAYAFPPGQCPSKYEVLSTITNQLGDDCCNPLYKGLDLCHRDCYRDIASHRNLVDALSVGVDNAIKQCESGVGLRNNLLFIYLDPIPKLMELMLESTGAAIAGTSTYAIPQHERACIGRAAQRVSDLYWDFGIKKSYRFLYRWHTMIGEEEIKFIQNVIEGSFPDVLRCRTWTRGASRIDVDLDQLNARNDAKMQSKDRGKRMIYLINRLALEKNAMH